MSLQELKITKNIMHPLLGIAFLDFALLMICIVMSMTVFANPSGVDLKVPLKAKGAIEGEVLAVIKITGENVIYFNNKVVTINDLRRLLSSTNFYNRELMIKADRRSAMGRVGDILDLCRGIAGARINVSTSN